VWGEIHSLCGFILKLFVKVIWLRIFYLLSFIGKIGLFFLVYYACLTAFFAAIFAIAFSTMPEIKDGPKYTSFISDKPCKLM
jgi:hypothetical protein